MYACTSARPELESPTVVVGGWDRVADTERQSDGLAGSVVGLSRRPGNVYAPAAPGRTTRRCLGSSALPRCSRSALALGLVARHRWDGPANTRTRPTAGDADSGAAPSRVRQLPRAANTVYRLFEGRAAAGLSSVGSRNHGVLHGPERGGRARRDANLVVDVLDVMIGGLGGDVEPIGNLLRRQPLGRQAQHVDLAT